MTTFRLREVASVVGGSLESKQAPAAHADLVDRLVAQISPAVLGGDLALIAYAVPDDCPHKTVATYLNLVTGGLAHSVAITGQGVGSPFTALRVARSYGRTGRSSKSVLAIVESAAPLSSDRSAPVEYDSGVLLVFDAGIGSKGVDGVHSLEQPGDLAALLAGLIPGDGSLLLVLGPTAEPGVLPEDVTDVHRVAAGSHCTSVWLALAQNYAQWAAAYSVIALSDTDPLTGVGHLAVLRD
ncbi:hypothetical protein D5S18_03735 [Nocardia panacis]|uniref:Uncharacterized protein n=1 Tax=Nocardia panacis TaxID=2340916 RepID=A0A3A4K2P4_9NOCA|nr:hypothetical protein [Nocardia panacis]RJO78958.1 hypothetical protein D5S18_03735 [Nocardia panacis]